MADNTIEDSGKRNMSSSSNPLLVLLVGLNTLVVIGVAYLQFRLYEQQASRPSIQDLFKADEAKFGQEARLRELKAPLISLNEFTANLAQGDGPRRYIRLKMVLKLSKDSKGEELNARKPQIRDAVINILNSKRPEDLLKVEGKDYLKKEIKDTINSFLLDGSVKDVFYISFQVN